MTNSEPSSKEKMAALKNKPAARVKIEYSQLERAENINEYSELNDWEQGFIKSIIQYLRKNSDNVLSVKQHEKLCYMEKRDDISIYKNCCRLGIFYTNADGSNNDASFQYNSTVKVSPEKHVTDWDGTGDDIPF